MSVNVSENTWDDRYMYIYALNTIIRYLFKNRNTSFYIVVFTDHLLFVAI